MASSKVVLAIRAFEKAVENKLLFEGDVAAEHNYVKARAKLERLMENV